MKFGLQIIVFAICVIEHNVKGQSGDILSDLLDPILEPIFGTVELELLGQITDACAELLILGEVKPIVAPNSMEISFQLRTPCSIESFSLNEIEGILDSNHFDRNKPLVVFVSGWLVRPEDTNIYAVERAYQCRNDSNFVVLDSAYFVNTLYTWSAYNTQAIGQLVAEALVKLVAKMPSLNIHLIGHSLGAQIVGSAGRHYYDLIQEKIPRITGLDPANPCFANGTSIQTIESSDAQFVDIIHTNSGVFGKTEPLGHVDFYVGGLNPIQPNCFILSCSHLRAISYYAESVYPGNGDNFMAIPCLTLTDVQLGNCFGQAIPMGHDTPADSRGLYYLTVNSEEPYGENASSTLYLTSECNICTL